MGREALVNADVDVHTGKVKALLESQELILRGEIRRRYPKATIQNLRIEGDALCFVVADEAVRLYLGSAMAHSWAKSIAEPPPSLRAKLGLQNGAKALLVGQCDDSILAEALDGALAHDAADAVMLIACIADAADLEAAISAQRATSPEFPIWAIYPKGKNVEFGDSAIRTAMRASGFRDSKTCAVSDRLTATRYNPPRDLKA